MKADLSRRPDGIVLLRLAGRLDAANAPALERTLTAARGEAPRLLLELSAVDFLDSSGLGALVGALKSCRRAGGDLRLAAPSAPVARLLRLTALDRVFAVGSDGEAEWEAMAKGG